MMLTSVELVDSSSSLRGVLLWPETPATATAPASIPAGVVAAYLLLTGEKKRSVHIFRTARNVREPGMARLLGVDPGGHVLLSAYSHGRIARIEALFSYLKRIGRDPSSLSDQSYVRVSHVLGGKLGACKALRRLLEHEDAA
jgi:hypothetical protein